MVTFWSSIVFQTGAYRGRPFDPHARMPGLGREHFARWVERFHRTVDDHFAGERAELMKARAEQIAGVFQVKLGLWRTFTSEAASESSDARKQEALRSSGR
jgi:hemoglobin